MKKFSILALALTLVLTASVFAGCRRQDPNAGQPESTQGSEQQTQPSTQQTQPATQAPTDSVLPDLPEDMTDPFVDDEAATQGTENARTLPGHSGAKGRR